MQRLIGRDAELAEIRAALLDPETRVLRVRGPSGSGKTALVRAAAGTVPDLIFGERRFPEQGSGGVAPILGGLALMVERALDLLYDPRAGAQSLRQVLGGGLDTLTRAGFAGERDFVGAGSPPTGVANGAAITEAALIVVRWLTGFGHAAALFVDDWQRAPRQAQTLLQALAREAGCAAFTVLVAERDEAPSSRVDAREIELGPLERPHRAQLLGDVTGDP
ncbi:MAG TPA: ATP-binding protein, partial [Caulobacteraceae bacterium]|nr:ATP-binding protein [Caulobacteraceae bacterium]